MKIFITGGAGFIGSHIVDELLEKGHDLICLTHSTKIDKKGVKIVHGDIREKSSFDEMKGCDAVIANAAIYVIHPPKKIRDIMWDVNVNGTKMTLDTALEYNIPKIIYVSSIAALGDTSNIDVPDEECLGEHCGKFASLYEKTKHEAHKYALKLIEEKNAPITIAMPGFVFGEKDHASMGDNLRDLVKGTLLGLIDSDAKYNFIHVEDVAHGIVLCLEKGKNESYIIAGPKESNITFGKFTKMAAELGDLELPKRTFTIGMVGMVIKMQGIKSFFTRKHPQFGKENLAALKISFVINSDKATRELGYSPKPLEERVKQTIDWYIKEYKK